MNGSTHGFSAVLVSADAGSFRPGWIRDRTACTRWALAAWVLVVIGGMGWMLRWSHSPDLSGLMPLRWPAQSELPLDPIRPTLLVFAHPRCPCTRTTLDELALLMARAGDRCRAWVILVQPAGTSAAWMETDLWQEAARIPGVTVYVDREGREARGFRAMTSGQTALYAADGRRLFQGGITVSRGHAGDNLGRSTLTAWLEHTATREVATPVFGCPLLGAERRRAAAELCRP